MTDDDLNSRLLPTGFKRAALVGVALSTMLGCAYGKEISVQDRNNCRTEAQTADLAAIRDLLKLQRDAALAGMSIDEYRQTTMMLRILQCIRQVEKQKGE